MEILEHLGYNKPKIGKISPLSFYSKKYFVKDIFNGLKNYFENIIMETVKVQVYNNSLNSLPKYETNGSAGMDVRADFSRVCPENPIKLFGEGEIIFASEKYPKTLLRLEPGSRALIPTGLYTSIPVGYEVQLRPRSGLAIKKGLNLINCLGTIDADYRNEWGIPVTNQGLETIWIEDGERICQAVLNEVPKVEWELVSNIDKLSGEDRGGGFGSTGIK